MRPRLTTTTFQEVGFTRAKTGVCPACGKTARRSKKFYQTLNPWNRGADGLPKDGGEIMDELRPKAAAWEKEPTYHAKCEPRP